MKTNLIITLMNKCFPMFSVGGDFKTICWIQFDRLLKE